MLVLIIYLLFTKQHEIWKIFEISIIPPDSILSIIPSMRIIIEEMIKIIIGMKINKNHPCRL